MRQVGAPEAAKVLAHRMASKVDLRHPRDVADLLDLLRRANASEAFHALLDRDPATHVTVEDPGEVWWLLYALHPMPLSFACSAGAAR